MRFTGIRDTNRPRLKTFPVHPECIAVSYCILISKQLIGGNNCGIHVLQNIEAVLYTIRTQDRTLTCHPTSHKKKATKKNRRTRMTASAPSIFHRFVFLTQRMYSVAGIFCSTSYRDAIREIGCVSSPHKTSQLVSRTGRYDLDRLRRVVTIPFMLVDHLKAAHEQWDSNLNQSRLIQQKDVLCGHSLQNRRRCDYSGDPGCQCQRNLVFGPLKQCHPSLPVPCRRDDTESRWISHTVDGTIVMHFRLGPMD